MKIIYTRKGEEIFVDDEDYEWLNEHTWFTSYGYAKRGAKKSDIVDTAQISMHRQIIKAKKDEIVDHIDRNRCNNQKYNLRICTKSENCKNKNVVKRNKSGYPGVLWEKRRQKWAVSITANKKRMSLGYYLNFDDAVNARKEAEIKYFGDFYAKDLDIDEGIMESSRNKTRGQKFSIDYKIRKNNISGMIGVGWEKEIKKWKVNISFEGKSIYLGCYSDLEEAKQVRLDAELKYYGRTVEDKNIEQC